MSNMGLTKKKFEDIKVDVTTWGLYNHFRSVIKDDDEIAFLEEVFDLLTDRLSEEDYDAMIKQALENFKANIEEEEDEYGQDD